MHPRTSLRGVNDKVPVWVFWGVAGPFVTQGQLKDWANSTSGGLLGMFTSLRACLGGCRDSTGLGAGVLPSVA